MLIKSDAFSASFSEKGLDTITAYGKTLPYNGIAFDLGCNGSNLTGLLAYDSLLEKHTWELPGLRPLPSDNTPLPGLRVTEGRAEAIYSLYPLRLTLCHEFLEQGALSVTAELQNISGETAYINTMTLAPVYPGAEGIRFSFPANVPHGVFSLDGSPERKAVCSGLAAFAIAAETPSGGQNFIFIDDHEKWSAGVWHRGKNTYFAFSAALEADLAPGESLTLGSLYIQPCAPGKDPFLQIRALADSLGYCPACGGAPDGVMYSCHPAGTMDANFESLGEDLQQYAKRLPALREMGIDYLWLLPVFDHDEKGVYHANDQSVIDSRYGGEEACAEFCRRARELGMTVMFDYVPHGPVPEHPLARDNPAWCSKRRNGTLQIEWDCVSMDYNHPGYRNYTTELVRGHVRRFGIAGARIDCAMGGLSNWQPCPGERPSGCGIRAGAAISAAIREGLLSGGAPVLNMPENFHPVPPYYGCTDVFYGMSFYRVLCELESLFHSDPARYTAELTDWLDTERKTLPEGFRKLRFLGNHDTVSWVWQARRAVDIYGTEGAKALWALISLIDGIPMIYQGDEDPSLYGKHEGYRLDDFFKRLFRLRAQIKGDKILWLRTKTPVVAFCRGENLEKLILVNLSPSRQAYEGTALEPYEYLILDRAEDKL